MTFAGVDVGTGSVRAGIFDAAGKRLGMGSQPIQMFRPQADFVEQSSDDIWRAAGAALRAALAQANLEAADIHGLGFDATCSLVALDAQDKPVSLSPTGRDEQNVIVWMDHRALAEATEINAHPHEVLRYVGGRISPEMEIPKLLWLKRHLPAAFARTARFLDLPDFLTCRATGGDIRSLCSTVCKWTYLGQEGRWDARFFERIGLREFVDEGFRRIGSDVRPLGGRAGLLTETSARELGLNAGIPVGIPIIDAHAGGLGMLGIADCGHAADFNTRLALIGGTSTCHMAVAREPRFIGGVWGPYYSAMLPEWWLTEGGQSATGALIDHVIDTHARGPGLRAQARRESTTAYALLNDQLEKLSGGLPSPAMLTQDLHVYPDFHGNRSPHADPGLAGMVSGLRLRDGMESLAALYLATIQAIAHGTREIVSALNSSGYRIDTLVACGGDTKNPVFVREHADITGCRVLLPQEPEAVLLGAAMLGAVAAHAHPTIEQAMAGMSRAGAVVEPARGETASYHLRKHAVFERMRADQKAYKGLMLPG